MVKISIPCQFSSQTAHSSCGSGPKVYHGTYLSVRIFYHVAAERMGYPGVQMARFLDVITSAVVHAANSENLDQISKYS